QRIAWRRWRVFSREPPACRSKAQNVQKRDSEDHHGRPERHAGFFAGGCHDQQPIPVHTRNARVARVTDTMDTSKPATMTHRSRRLMIRTTSQTQKAANATPKAAVNSPMPALYAGWRAGGEANLRFDFRTPSFYVSRRVSGNAHLPVQSARVESGAWTNA